MEVPRPACNKRADTYFGRRSASLMKEFWTLCIFVMTVSKTVMVETIPHSNIGLTMDYLRMDGKQYASKVRNKALEDFDWLSQWLE